MNRRTFLQCGMGTAWAVPLLAAMQRQDPLEHAAEILDDAVTRQQVSASVLYVRHGSNEFARAFGAAESVDAPFLLASISKPLSVSALMTLYDQGRFQLDDPVRTFLPEFRGEGRDAVTIRHLLTHVSGLPDQLPENEALRQGHAPLSEFVARALKTPLLFPPGSRYEYSSMAILLAAEIAQRLSGTAFPEFIEEVLFEPLEMKRSALGLGRFPLEAVVQCQVEAAAPESGAGDASARDWDWNSPYWRGLGAPWGGAHGSAPDVARFFEAFLWPRGKALRPETARLMIQNHNPEGLRPRGLGFELGASAGSPGCSEQTFGHSGATGTLAWADPQLETICVVLTTLPGQAVQPHPRQLVSDRVASAIARQNSNP